MVAYAMFCGVNTVLIQGAFGTTHQQDLAQVIAQAPNLKMHIQAGYISAAPTGSVPQLAPLTSNTVMDHKMLSSVLEHNHVTDLSRSYQRSKMSSFTADKPADDGYDWHTHGQKQGKGSEYSRRYHKCSHVNCQVKKVEHSHGGQVTEIVYKSKHNNQLRQSKLRAKDAGNALGISNFQGDNELGSEGTFGTSHQRALAHVMVQAAETHSQMNFEVGYPSAAPRPLPSNTIMHRKMLSSVPEQPQTSYRAKVAGNAQEISKVQGSSESDEMSEAGVKR